MQLLKYSLLPLLFLIALYPLFSDDVFAAFHKVPLPEVPDGTGSIGIDNI